MLYLSFFRTFKGETLTVDAVHAMKAEKKNTWEHILNNNNLG